MSALFERIETQKNVNRALTGKGINTQPHYGQFSKDTLFYCFPKENCYDMAMAQLCCTVTNDLAEKKRTNMSAMVFNFIKAQQCTLDISTDLH